jgi:hypothetical protein
MDLSDQNKIEDPYFIGAFVTVKIAQNEGLITNESAIALINVICKTHDIENTNGIFENEKIRDYVDLVVKKNSRAG